jgi:hypothetical protein
MGCLLTMIRPLAWTADGPAIDHGDRIVMSCVSEGPA